MKHKYALLKLLKMNKYENEMKQYMWLNTGDNGTEMNSLLNILTIFLWKIALWHTGGHVAWPGIDWQVPANKGATTV